MRVVELTKLLAFKIDKVREKCVYLKNSAFKIRFDFEDCCIHAHPV